MSPVSADPGIDARLAAGLAPLATSLVEWSQDALVLKRASDGVWLYASARMADWLGRSDPALAGRTDAELFGEAAAALRAADQAAMEQGGPHVSEHKLDLSGGRREFAVLRLPLMAADGGQVLAAVWRDLAPGRRREAQLRLALEQLEQAQLANEKLRAELQGQLPRDSATGLYNRAHFDDQLRREVDLSTREHREFALVSIEVDPLPDEAQAPGGAVRSRVHETLGQLLRSNTRAMDASCRYDGGRFAVLLSGVGLATAHSRMEGLRRQCATQIVAHEGREVGFTVSMGVASFPHTAQTQDELWAACEAALGDARQRGGNRVTLASIRFDAGA
jgi:diguanylate cyclase (GGDEF)-like protein